MNAILKTFNRPRVLLPVVHCCDVAQTRDAIAVATENGADGLWFINQGGLPWYRVVEEAERARAAGVWSGINPLGLGFNAALAAAQHLDGLWRDSAGVHDDDPIVDSRLALVFGEQRQAARWAGTYFGGVAFKYTSPVGADAWGPVASAAARAGVDVVTTSGPATGSAPPVEKVAAMRRALGDHALAVASGITPENVEPFLEHVDAFLVATGIEERFGVFDPGRLRALADAIHGARRA